MHCLRSTFCLLLLLVFCLPLFAEDPEAMRRLITDEAPAELVNLDLDDSDVSLRISGRWRGTLQASWGLSFSPFGTTSLSGDVPLFTQEGDLTLALWLWDRWFVEANFIDNSALNTYRMGYQGREGEVVRYFGIGNTGLDFPSFPYLDLGGDSPSSFGAYGHFSAGNLHLHTLLRYDNAAREERTFIGNHERSFSFVDLSRPLRGRSFVLPDENIADTPLVFIQDNRGDLRDLQGRRWRLLDPSEYAVSARLGLVELTLGGRTGGAEEPEGMVAVFYSGGYSLGTYDGTGPGGTFLAEVQDFFSAHTNIELWHFPQPGSQVNLGNTNNVPGTVTIDGMTALVIYEPGTFSPFERQNRYRSPAASSSAELVRLSTGEIVRYDGRGFELFPLEDINFEILFDNQEHISFQRGIFELISEGSRGRRYPEERWPLGSRYPGLYLPGRTVFTEDVGIRFTHYTHAGTGGFFIGTDVLPGSIQVFRNGIPDPNFAFNSFDGTVVLRNPAGFNELIRISYLRQSADGRHGSLAAGVGAIWEDGGPFTARLGLGLRWNLTTDTFTESDTTSPGTVGLGAEARWNYDRFRAGVSFGLGFEQPDTTGLFRVAGMDGNEIILPLPSGPSFISETPASLAGQGGSRADLVFRNFRESNILGGASLGDISAGASIISGQSGPYPAMDRTFASQVLVAEFEFSQANAWTGFQVPLGFNAEFFESAGKIDVPFRFMNFYGSSPLDAIRVTLQIGVLADRDTGNPENPNLQIDILLYEGLINSPNFNRPYFIIEHTFTDSERSQLQGAKYMRLLIERSGGTGNMGGRVILAPPRVQGAGWRPVTIDLNNNNEIKSNTGILSGPQVNAIEVNDHRLEIAYPDIIRRLNSTGGRQRVLEISWTGLDAGHGAGADTRIAAIPLANYSSLSFFVRKPEANDPLLQADLNNAYLHFVIAQSPLSLRASNENQIILEHKIPLSSFGGINPGEWIRVDIPYTRSPAAFHFPDGNSYYVAFFIVPENSLAVIPNGNFAVDEIILENPIPSYRLNSGAFLEWTRPGAVLMAGNHTLVSDLSFLTAVESASAGNPFEEDIHGNFGISGRSQAGLSILGLAITGNYSYSFASSQYDTVFTWSAGHTLFRSFGAFSFWDSFDITPTDRALNHRLALALDTRVRANLSGELRLEDERLRRNWQAGTNGRPAEHVPFAFSLDASMGVNERNTWQPDFYNYAGTWVYSFVPLLPDSGYGAESRQMRCGLRLRLETLPLGAELFFHGNTYYSQPRDTIHTGSLLRLDLPFNPGPNMLFRIEREYRSSLVLQSADFFSDGEIWGQNLNSALPLMFAVPFYSLFYSGLELPENANSEFIQFSDRFEFSLLRPMNYGISSLFIPRRFTFRLGRVLEQRMDTLRDSFNVGAAMGFSSINLFGAMGVNPVFTFYQGDEFAHSLETQIVFPKGENVSWNIRADQSLSFFAFSGAALGINNTFVANSSPRFGEGIRLSDSLSITWTVPMQTSLIGTLYESFLMWVNARDNWASIAQLAEMNHELFRRSTLEAVFERIPDSAAGDYFRYSLILGHESFVRILGRLNFSVFGRLAISQNARAEVFSFLGTIGTSLHLMF